MRAASQIEMVLAQLVRLDFADAATISSGRGVHAILPKRCRIG
jgi:hypothetical protein